MHSKWILLESHRHGILHRPKGHFSLCAFSASNKTSHDTMASREGIPLPTDHSEVADCMECWGRRIDGEWEQVTLNTMLAHLKNGEHMPHKDLFCKLTPLVVERHSWLAFDDCHLVTDVMESHQCCCDRMCGFETTKFCELSVKSLDFGQRTIQINITPQPVPQPVVSPVVVESTPDIVESG